MQLIQTWRTSKIIGIPITSPDFAFFRVSKWREMGRQICTSCLCSPGSSQRGKKQFASKSGIYRSALTSFCDYLFLSVFMV